MSLLELKIAGICMMLAGLLIGFWVFEKHEQQLGAAACTAAVSAATVKAQEQASADHQATIEAQAEVTHVAALSSSRTLTDLRSADAAHQRLLDLAVSVDRCTSQSPASASGGSPNAAASGPVLGVYVSSGIDDAAGQLALYSDQLSTALAACIGSYKALK